MVKGALWKKAFQDMRKSKAQFISIFVMAALAIGMLTGLDSLYRTVDTHSSNLYSATNLSDLWVTVSNPSEKDLWRVGRIAGVEQVEKRFSIDAETNLPGEPTLHVYALESRSTLDQPDLQAGRFGKRGGAVLDATFAKAHGLGIGDSVSVKMNGRWLELPIEGLALSGEQIYSLKNSATMTPDPNTYGFVVIRADVLSGIYGQAVFNQISVKTAHNADLSSVIRQADEAIGNRLIGIVARDDSVSASNVISLAQQFKTLSNVFPALFFLVAALITQSTMVRLVENQRSRSACSKRWGTAGARFCGTIPPTAFLWAWPAQPPDCCWGRRALRGFCCRRSIWYSPIIEFTSTGDIFWQHPSFCFCVQAGFRFIPAAACWTIPLPFCCGANPQSRAITFFWNACPLCGTKSNSATS